MSSRKTPVVYDFEAAANTSPRQPTLKGDDEPTTGRALSYAEFNSRLEEEFKAYDARHPDVWRLFVHFANMDIDRGKKRLSAAFVTERIRESYTHRESRIADNPKRLIKIPNAHRAYYARKFNSAFPDSPAKFVTDSLRSS